MCACRNGIGACACNEVQLSVVHSGEHRYCIGVLCLNGVAKTARRIGAHFHLGGEKLERSNLLNFVQKRGGLHFCDAGICAFQLAAQLLHLGLHSRRLFRNALGVGGFELSCGVADKLVALCEKSQYAKAGGALNSAHARGNGGLGDNLEKTYGSGVLYVGSSAQFGGGGAYLYDSDARAVLLAEECHGAHLLCLVGGGDYRVARLRLQNVFVNDSFYCRNLLCGHCREVREVEAHSVLVHVGACLLDVCAEYAAQSGLEQMRGGVVASDGVSARGVNGCAHDVAYLNGAVINSALMNKNSILLLGVGDGERCALALDHAGVADLTTALAVEGGAVEYYGALALGKLGYALLVGYDSKHLCLGGAFGITYEFSSGEILQQRLRGVGPTGNVASCGSGALLLLLHECAVSVLVDLQPGFLCDLARKVNGEAEGVVELEGVGAGKGICALRLGVCDDAGENSESGVYGSVEALLLLDDDLEDIVALGLELDVSVFVLGNNDFRKALEEHAVDAEELTVTAGAADNSSEHVAAALVGGDNAVGDHEGSRSYVVGDNANGNVVVLVCAVGLLCDGADGVEQASYGVNLKEVVHTLHNARQTLKTHTGIDILLRELGVVAVAVVVELGEYVVPYLHESVAVASGLAIGRATAVLQAAVEIYFGAGAAGTGAVLPEVVCLAESDDVSLGHADLVAPDSVRLVVLLVNGGPEQICGDLKTVGEEFPCPRNSLVLEVIAEGEVAQHLEIGAVAGGVSHALKVRGSDTLLAGADAISRRLLLSGEELLHRRHARVDQEQGFIVVGYQGKAGES